MKRRITENLDIDVENRTWLCHHCGHALGSAEKPYKQGCLVSARSPHEIWRPHVRENATFSYDPTWCQIVEFYCPGCGWLIEVEPLPPGHPITNDIQLDLDRLSLREG